MAIYVVLMQIFFFMKRVDYFCAFLALYIQVKRALSMFHLFKCMSNCSNFVVF